jgi:hypothetical protein
VSVPYDGDTVIKYCCVKQEVAGQGTLLWRNRLKAASCGWRSHSVPAIDEEVAGTTLAASFWPKLAQAATSLRRQLRLHPGGPRCPASAAAVVRRPH